MDSLGKQKNFSFKDAMGIILLGIVLSLGLNYLFAVSGFLQSSEIYNQVAERQFSRKNDNNTCRNRSRCLSQRFSATHKRFCLCRKKQYRLLRI